MKNARPLAAFPATRHSVIDVLRTGDDEGRRAAFDALARGYWHPVCDYLRVRRQISIDDAEDLTQSFFARAMTKRVFERFDPQKARFRTYLRVCVDRFASNEWRRERNAMTSANENVDDVSDDQLIAAAGDTADDQVLKDAWVRWFFDRATTQLEQKLTAAGKGIHFALFQAYDLGRLGDKVPPTYPELAERFALPVTQVTNFLALARREFRRQVLEELAQTSASDADYRHELQELLGEAE